VFDSRQLSRAPLRRDPWVHAEAASAIEAAVPIDRERHELLFELEVSVVQALPRIPAIEEQGRRLGVSQRTLRRRLAAFGTTYEAIVDGTRAAAVRHLLTTSTAPLDEIAHSAGFSDARSLRRAVIRWTGSPPSALRRRPPQA
jgi:AraC-like DNA-binding protein